MTSPSPPRRRRRRRERDAPPGEAAEDDPSPPREARRREGPSGSPTRRGRRDPEPEEEVMITSPPPRRWARHDLKAGLLTAKEFREEVRKIKEDEELEYSAMDPSLTGEGARPVFRDKQGRRISEHQMLSSSADKDKDERKKPTQEHGGLEDDEEMRGSGFVVPQDVPGNSWMRRGVDPPANRYGVKPGRHWDGVDRGNGFDSSGVTVEEKKRPLWYVSES